MRRHNTYPLSRRPRLRAGALAVLLAFSNGSCSSEKSEEIPAGTAVYNEAPIGNNHDIVACGQLSVAVSLTPIDSALESTALEARFYQAYSADQLSLEPAQGGQQPCQPDADSKLWVLGVAANKNPAWH